MAETRYRVVITDQAVKMLREVGKRYGRKSYQVLRNLIEGLETEPGQKGQALRHPLHGFHSLHYSRFRVIYRIEDERLIVYVVAAGHHASGERGDIYTGGGAACPTGRSGAAGIV